MKYCKVQLGQSIQQEQLTPDMLKACNKQYYNRDAIVS